jgi:hypothetical protein
MGYGLDGLGSIPCSARFFSLHSFQTDSWAYPASYPVGTGGGSFYSRKAAGEADHSSTSSVEIKKGGVIPPLTDMSP